MKVKVFDMKRNPSSEIAPSSDKDDVKRTAA
jgi:hypothetical protein